MGASKRDVAALGSMHDKFYSRIKSEVAATLAGMHNSFLSLVSALIRRCPHFVERNFLPYVSPAQAWGHFQAWILPSVAQLEKKNGSRPAPGGRSLTDRKI